MHLSKKNFFKCLTVAKKKKKSTKFERGGNLKLDLLDSLYGTIADLSKWDNHFVNVRTLFLLSVMIAIKTLLGVSYVTFKSVYSLES